ncbi:MAG: nitroreductase family protein [Candidatus Methanoperedens sp.]|nr:nitroreductase family protein [Candidatus Methanoperedens sp.]MCZ7396458.1 nitroreductase family protein [Candidatus Methanoperedens sp.]
MDCMEAINGRRSVRKFKDRAVGKEIIEELLKAAQMAPSAGNLQARDFIVVSNKISKQKLKEAALGQSFIEQAPVVIVVVANIERSSRIYRSRGELYGIQDATAGVENMLLAAHSMGLATCWVGAFDENAVSEMLGIPHKTRPVAIIPVGYADEAPAAPPRMGLDRVVHMETW